MNSIISAGRPVASARSMISLSSNGKVMHNQRVTRVVLRERYISVGCSDVSIEVIEYLLKVHREHFPPNKPVEIELQP